MAPLRKQNKIPQSNILRVYGALEMAMHKHRLGSARFGVTTFFAYTHSSDQVGPDGLPVTPSAVRILGKFSQLKELNHKNLTAYIDIARLKNGMITLP